MDVVNAFLNLVAPPFTFFTLLLFLPPYTIFKFFLSTLTSFFAENVAGKVVLITGASSGIGEHLAYEYARKGACLALVARRQDQLQQVAELAREIGSPDVIFIPADVSKVDDCKRMVDLTVEHFGRLDHLVNNAGIHQICMFDEADDVTVFRTIMDVNFWGTAYTTRYAVPHLKESNGKVIVISSSGSWLSMPRAAVYNASEAALLQFFDSLRIELGPDVKITVVTPGMIESELTQGKFLNKEGRLVFDQEMRDAQFGAMPVRRVESCARAIVKSACRGDRYVTDPGWFRITFWLKVLCPEIVDLFLWIYNITKPGGAPHEFLNKRILDLTGAHKILYPDSIQAPPSDRKAD